jgi:hypothetical protein
MLASSLTALLSSWFLLLAAGTPPALCSLEPPSKMTFRGAVLHAPPFATVVEQEDGNIEYGGLQVDLLNRMKIFAAEDNVELTVDLSPAPPQYGPAFNLVANDCNSTVNPNPAEDCERFDVMVANFYATPSRSLRADLSPGWLRSTISTVKYTAKIGPDFTTMTQASAAGETVCLKDGTFYSGVVRAKFPGAKYQDCPAQEDCLNALKNEECVLYASDELQLRYRAANDATLQVTPEFFNTQYIVWAIKDNTPYVRFFEKWIYDSITNTTMDELYFKYFQKELCPVGTAGEKCELPCDPNHGKADDRGVCICTSAKYTGGDCSIEVEEELDLIPNALKIMSWVLLAINGLTIVGFAGWLFWKRKTAQVRMSQPFFLCLILLGCLISSSTIVAMMQENEGDGPEPACMAIPWLYSVGFSITFGTLFAKIRRVYLIFRSAADLRRHTVTFQETLAVTAGVLLLDIAILTVWTVVDPLRWERTTVQADKFGEPLESEGHCTSDHWQWWTGTIAVLHVSLMGFACYLCYVSRDIPTKFSEGKYVSIAMFSNLQIFVVGVPILVILGSDPDASFFVRTLIIWMNDFMVVTLIFGNLIYHVHFSKYSHRRSFNEAIGTAISSFSNRRKERSTRMMHSKSRLSSRRMSSSAFDPDALEEIKEGSKETDERAWGGGISATVGNEDPTVSKITWAGLEVQSSVGNSDMCLDTTYEDEREHSNLEEREEDTADVVSQLPDTTFAEGAKDAEDAKNTEKTASPRGAEQRYSTDETDGTSRSSSQ